MRQVEEPGPGNSYIGELKQAASLLDRGGFWWSSELATLRDMNVRVRANDARQVEVLAQDLPCFVNTTPKMLCEYSENICEKWLR